MKKTIALILVLTMALCLFAGCGAQSNTPASSTDAVTPDAPVEPNVPEQPEEPETPEEPEQPEVVEPAGVDLTILYERDDSMINNYSLLQSEPRRMPNFWLVREAD